MHTEITGSKITITMKKQTENDGVHAVHPPLTVACAAASSGCPLACQMHLRCLIDSTLVVVI